MAHRNHQPILTLILTLMFSLNAAAQSAPPAPPADESAQLQQEVQALQKALLATQAQLRAATEQLEQLKQQADADKLEQYEAWRQLKNEIEAERAKLEREGWQNEQLAAEHQQADLLDAQRLAAMRERVNRNPTRIHNNEPQQNIPVQQASRAHSYNYPHTTHSKSYYLYPGYNYSPYYRHRFRFYSPRYHTSTNRIYNPHGSFRIKVKHKNFNLNIGN